MAHEASIVQLYGPNNGGQKVRRTIASTAVVPVGSLMVLSDPNTAAVSSTISGAMCAGIAAEEKKGNGEDYATTIACYTQGVFDLVSSGSIALGAPVILSDTPNCVSPIGAGTGLGSGAAIVGIAEEAGTGPEVIRVRINI